ncbi:MAG: hypothetical protein IT385_11210 [Deltaproteobacteria bacterium]|nr:hypothetical protein [Deltaproteobacteria bacterium]
MTGPWLERARARLAAPRIDRWIIALALLLLAPSLTGGLASDDHLHRIVVRDDPGLPGYRATTLDLFTFVPGDAADRQALMDRGVLPWTAHPELRIGFMRPLAALTHRIDHALWPDTPALAHAHGLVWLVLLLIVVARLYRRIAATPWVAGLALLLYALDDAHAPTVSWIANRHALVSAVFGLAAVLAHTRARRGEGATRRSGQALAALLFALALAAGESALACAGYLVAFALVLDEGSARDRALSLAPYAVVLAAWAIAYAALGYGVRGSGVYVDPAADPVGFAGAVAGHVPVLLVGQLAGIWSEIHSALPPDGATLYVIGCAVWVLLWLDALKVVLRVSREARFWAVGMGLSLVPVASSFPSDRLLVVAGVGAMGLVACFLHAPEGTPGFVSASALRRFTVRVWTAGLVLTHLVAGPLLVPVRAFTMHTVAASLERADRTIPADAGVVGRTVIAVNPPADPYMAYVPIMRASRGAPIPGALRWLAIGQGEVVVTREDAATLHVAPRDGYLRMASERMVRDPRDPMRVGHRVRLAGVDVEVTALTADGRPAATRWRFDRPLEDPTWTWLRWSDAPLGFVPWTPPAIGDRTTLPAIDTLRAFLGE